MVLDQQEQSEKLIEEFGRQILVPGINEEGQQNISKKKICIIGLGALGTVASQYLVRAGVGEIHLVDYDIIDYITTSTLGNATDFGNLIFDNYGGGGCSNAIRGIRGGGAYVPNTLQSEMEFITISTTGDAAAFGDLTTNAWYTAACSSPTRGVFGGGANPSRHNVIQFVQIMSKGNSIDFGDLLDAIYEGGGLSNGNGGLG